MRWLLALLEALTVLAAADAQTPRYEVVNRTTPQPAFTVVNRTATAQPLRPIPYADLYARVGAGEKIIALVNLPAADRQAPVVPAPPGWVLVRCDDAPVGAGRWECWKDDAGQHMRQITEYAAMGVAARPFQESRTTKGTGVSSAVINPRPVRGLGSSGAIFPVVNTFTGATNAAQLGGTDCIGFR